MHRGRLRGFPKEAKLISESEASWSFLGSIIGPFREGLQRVLLILAPSPEDS